MSGTSDTRKPKRRRDPEAAAAAVEAFADQAVPTPVASAQPSLASEDGGKPTRRARYLRRRAANRSRQALGKPPLSDIRPGTCEPCGGWGTLGECGVRCQLCMGEGD